MIGFATAVTAALLVGVSRSPDPVGWTVVGLVAAQAAFGVAVGRLQLAPPGWGARAPVAPLPPAPPRTPPAQPPDAPPPPLPPTPPLLQPEG